MPFAVFLTEDAVRDLDLRYGHIAQHDSPRKAARVLGRIEKAFFGLSELLGRGSHPKELLARGIREYREIFFKPYRIIHRIMGKSIYVLLITDGRRDMQALLQPRLFAV